MSRRRSWFANDDMAANVLSRLSAKALHCLKFVSKEWLNLITERSFVSLQLKPPKEEPLSGFFFQEVFQWTDDEHTEIVSYIPIAVDVERVNVSRTVLDFLPDNVVVLSLNNGLLCCRSCFPSSQPMIYVCNPLNKQWRSMIWPNLRKDCRVGLAFDPVLDPVDVSTDFKLVAVTGVVMDDVECHFFFDIYSSKARSWRRIKECVRCTDLALTKNGGVLAEGMLYWLTEGYRVVMFDPESELSLLIECPLPATEFTSIPEICIGESQGKLHYVIISEHGLQLWILQDQFVPQWDLKFCASLEELERENPYVLYNIEAKLRSQLYRDAYSWIDPLSFKDGKLLLRVSVVVYLYEFDTRTMKELCDVAALGPKAMFSPTVVPYTMSLVPVEQA